MLGRVHSPLHSPLDDTTTIKLVVEVEWRGRGGTASARRRPEKRRRSYLPSSGRSSESSAASATIHPSIRPVSGGARGRRATSRRHEPETCAAGGTGTRRAAAEAPADRGSPERRRGVRATGADVVSGEAAAPAGHARALLRVRRASVRTHAGSLASCLI